MLKNKFGMTKVLVLVLSVLMLVSLVACNKADGPSTDDMNAAIQAAIDAANAEQAAKEAALAASIAADKAAQEAKDAAQAESLAKEKAENDAALKKAQEEAAAAAKKAEEASKAAADAAKKAAEEAAKAAEEAAKANEAALKKAQEEAAAAKKAAEEASKAAAEAAAKAQSEADRVASELAAELEAAKAEALKAQEEAAKAQEEASKAIAEASKAAEEAAKASSQLAETTVVPATTPAETTVVAPAETTVAPETTTEAPIVIVDKTDALLAYSQLKVKYTITDYNLYLTENAAQIVLLFDKASIDLNNAATAEAAASIVATLEIDAAAVPNAKNDAKAVQALIADLGDIETEVFTVQAEKITAARDAYKAFKELYGSKATAKVLELIDEAELSMAESKLKVIEGYIKSSLHADMKTIYDAVEGKFSRFDAEDYVKAAEKATVITAIENAHYSYLVLAAINDGNVDAADLAVAFEKKIDSTTGKKTDEDDTTKPTKWFTVEDLLEIFILPTADYKFEAFIQTNILDGAKATFDTNISTFHPATSAYIVNSSDIDDEIETIYDELEAELKALTFSADYKGNKTLAQAYADVYKTAVKAYIDALNVYLDAMKAVAIEVETKDTAEDIEDIDELIAALEEDLTEEGAAVTVLTGKIARLEANKATAEANLDSFIANVNAAALPTYEEFAALDAKTAKALGYADGETHLFVNISKVDSTNGVGKTEIVDFLNNALQVTITKNFKAKLDVEGADAAETVLLQLVEYAVEQLEALRVRVDTVALEDGDNDLFLNLRGDEKTIGYGDNATTYYPNEAKFPEIVALINDAIAQINAVSVDEIAPKNEKLPSADAKDKFYFYKDADAKAYVDSLNLSLEDIIELYVADIESTKDVNENEPSPLTIAKSGDYPIYYVITPAEQAIEKVATILTNAFTDVNKKLVALDGTAAAKKLLISNGDKTDYDKVLGKATDATLKAELKTIGDAYINSIDTEAAKLKYNSALAVANFYTKKDKLNRDDNDNIDMIIVGIPTVDDTDDYVDYAAAYDYTGYQDDMQTIVDNFNKNFFVGSSSAELMNAKAAVLYAYKQEVIKDITTAMAAYKNTFTTDENGNIVNSHTAVYDYEYADKADYEAELDTLLETYTKNINAITLNKGYLEISYGKTGKVKIGDYLFDKEANSGTKIDYTLAIAKAAVDAYEEALFGTIDNKKADLSGTDTVERIVKGNSQIFKTYNSVVLDNIFGYTVK